METKRTRNRRIQFRVTEDEYEQLKSRMAQYGTDNMEMFLRKTALNGYVLQLDIPQLQEMNSLMRRMSNNLNQLTRRVNTNGHLYEADLEEIQQAQKQIWTGIHEILTHLTKLD